MATKLNKLFQIDEYNLFDDEIEIFTISKNEEKHYMIPRIEFEDWLRDTDRLDWVRDEMTNGEYVQSSGTIPAQQFWEQTQTFIKETLYEFILLKRMDSAKMLDSVWQGLNKIKDYPVEIKVGSNCNPVLKTILNDVFPNAKYSQI